MRRSFRELPIRGKVRWIAALASSTALLSGGLILAFYDNRSSRAAIVRRLHAEADVIGLSSASALLFHDEAAAAATLAALKGNPEVVGAALYGEEGRVFASWRAE